MLTLTALCLNVKQLSVLLNITGVCQTVNRMFVTLDITNLCVEVNQLSVMLNITALHLAVTQLSATATCLSVNVWPALLNAFLYDSQNLLEIFLLELCPELKKTRQSLMESLQQQTAQAVS